MLSAIESSFVLRRKYRRKECGCSFFLGGIGVVGKLVVGGCWGGGVGGGGGGGGGCGGWQRCHEVVHTAVVDLSMDAHKDLRQWCVCVLMRNSITCSLKVSLCRGKSGLRTRAHTHTHTHTVPLSHAVSSGIATGMT